MGVTPSALIDFARRFDGATADPLVRQRLVDTHIRYELLRFLRYRNQTALSQGRRPGGEASVMKLAFARYLKAPHRGGHRHAGRPTACSVATTSPDDGMWLLRFLHAPSLRIAGGSDQVQANIMGERVLGLPGRAAHRQGRAVPRPRPAIAVASGHDRRPPRARR